MHSSQLIIPLTATFLYTNFPIVPHLINGMFVEYPSNAEVTEKYSIDANWFINVFNF